MTKQEFKQVLSATDLTVDQIAKKLLVGRKLVELWQSGKKQISADQEEKLLALVPEKSTGSSKPFSEIVFGPQIADDKDEEELQDMQFDDITVNRVIYESTPDDELTILGKTLLTYCHKHHISTDEAFKLIDKHANQIQVQDFTGQSTAVKTVIRPNPHLFDMLPLNNKQNYNR